MTERDREREREKQRPYYEEKVSGMGSKLERLLWIGLYSKLRTFESDI